MTPWYALGNFTNHTGMVEYLQVANEQYTGGWCGALVLLGLWMTLFIVLINRAYHMKFAWTVASFLAAVFAVFLRTAGLVQERWVIALIIMTGLGLVSLMNWGETPTSGA